jgi:hypothetical protein
MLPPSLINNLLIQNIAQNGSAAFARRLTLCRTCDLVCPGFADCTIDRVNSPVLGHAHPESPAWTFHVNVFEGSSDIIHLHPA